MGAQNNRLISGGIWEKWRDVVGEQNRKKIKSKYWLRYHIQIQFGRTFFVAYQDTYSLGLNPFHPLLANPLHFLPVSIARLGNSGPLDSWSLLLDIGGSDVSTVPMSSNRTTQNNPGPFNLRIRPEHSIQSSNAQPNWLIPLVRVTWEDNKHQFLREVILLIIIPLKVQPNKTLSHHHRAADNLLL